MPSSALTTLLWSIAIVFLLVGLALAYLWIRYAPIIGRIFEDSPVFRPLRADPLEGGEEVRFPTADGYSLAGTYLRSRQGSRIGVIVFCHEFLGDRSSAGPYAGTLLDLGFDLFSFDFRNHGESDSEPGHSPLQWTSNRETRDLKAALAYLRNRSDADPAGVGLFGVSRGGATAMAVAAREPRVWGVVTDSAFPTRGTMTAYILRWAEIYVGTGPIWRAMPLFVFKFVGWAGRKRTERRLGRRFPDIERAVARIGPRPLLMIHGEKDNYIGPDIARGLFAHVQEPKELWIVAGAKHNRSREVDPIAYREHVENFFRRYAPRRPGTGKEANEEPDAAVGSAATGI